MSAKTNCLAWSGPRLPAVLLTVLCISYTAFAFGPDADNDGMSDAWENVHGLNIATNDASLDNDSDGLNNYAEYIADTNPWNATSLPVLGMSFWTVSPVRLLYADTSSNRIYAVDYRDDLLSGEWIPLKENIQGRGAIGLAEDEELIVSNRYYRMRARFPELMVTPFPIGFGPITPGQTSAVQTVYIVNTSSTNQTLSALIKQGTNSADFILSSLPTNTYVLKPGESLPFGAAFAPTAGGVRSGELVLQFSGNLTTNLYVNLAGATTCDTYINAGGTNYIGATNLWVQDIGLNRTTSGSFANLIAISGTEDDPLYQTERFGIESVLGRPMNYHIPVVPGRYEVVLHFAEIVPMITSAGQRVFDVEVEGATVLSNLDIYAQVGFAAALATNFTVDVTDYSLDIIFKSKIQNPKISAIEVHSLTKIQSTTPSKKAAAAF